MPRDERMGNMSHHFKNEDSHFRVTHGERANAGIAKTGSVEDEAVNVEQTALEVQGPAG